MNSEGSYGRRDRVEITTDNGETFGRKHVQHWALFFRGQFVADTSVPEHVEYWKELADWANRN